MQRYAVGDIHLILLRELGRNMSIPTELLIIGRDGADANDLLSDLMVLSDTCVYLEHYQATISLSLFLC